MCLQSPMFSQFLNTSCIKVFGQSSQQCAHYMFDVNFICKMTSFIGANRWNQQEPDLGYTGDVEVPLGLNAAYVVGRCYVQATPSSLDIYVDQWSDPKGCDSKVRIPSKADALTKKAIQFAQVAVLRPQPEPVCHKCGRSSRMWRRPANLNSECISHMQKRVARRRLSVRSCSA